MDTTHKQSVNESLKLLVDRDGKDALIDHENRIELVNNGFSIIDPDKAVEIDTGEVVGIENVVDIVVDNIEPEYKIIAVEGLSGVGKSSTTHELKKRLNASVLSLSDIFRLLTWQYFVKEQKSHEENIQNLKYEIEDGGLCLKCEGEHIENLRKHLHDPEFSVMIPDVAKETQEMVIKFVAEELAILKNEYQGHILLEGRAFTLDFMPCDLRVKLSADPMIRAKRRLEQYPTNG